MNKFIRSSVNIQSTCFIPVMFYFPFPDPSPLTFWWPELFHCALGTAVPQQSDPGCNINTALLGRCQFSCSLFMYWLFVFFKSQRTQNKIWGWNVLTSHFCLQTINPSYERFCFQKSVSFDDAAHTHVCFASLYILSSQYNVWYEVNSKYPPPGYLHFFPFSAETHFFFTGSLMHVRISSC